MKEKSVIRMFEKRFIKDDKKDPDYDRKYVKETKRIFKLLKGEMNIGRNSTDAAIYNVFHDLLRYYEDRKFHVIE